MNQRKQRKSSREIKELPLEKAIFFEHEGLTELNYLQKLRQIIIDQNLDISFNYGDSSGKSPKTCIENLIKKKRSCGRDGDLFIAICDVDDFNKNNKSGNKTNLQKAVKFAKDNGIELLISNICFEQWLEFHRGDNQYLKEEDKSGTIKRELSKLVVKDKNFIKTNIGGAYKIAKNRDNLSDKYPKNYGSRMWRLLEILEEKIPNLKITLK